LKEERWERIRRLVDAIRERKGEEIVVLDVSDVSSFADTFLLVTGRSERNVQAIVDAVTEASRAMGERPLGVEGYQEGRWVLVDLADVIVHVFVHEVRDEYQLERLYADAHPVELATGAAR
jgi:ribosome-associated protein